MTPLDIGSIIVAIVAALGAWAAQRSAAKSNTFNTLVAGRLDAEREAYERARGFDVETIKRQDAEINELRAYNEALKNELKQVKARLRKLEVLFPEWERLLNERLAESDDHE